MIVSVFGTGNSGAALVHGLLNAHGIEELRIASHRRVSAEAAYLDAVSSTIDPLFPIRVVDAHASGEAEAIVLSSGMQIPEGASAGFVFDQNAEMLRRVCDTVSPRDDSIVIVIASPVDDVTSVVRDHLGARAGPVIGFGGDLDFARLRHSLRIRRLPCKPITIVGEHGRNAIPVFEPEEDYSRVARDIRTHLPRITEGGRPRNLATGAWLAELVESLANGAGRTHIVSAPHPAFGLALTWPFRVQEQGRLEMVETQLPPLAAHDLDRLIDAKRRMDTARLDSVL